MSKQKENMMRVIEDLATQNVLTASEQKHMDRLIHLFGVHNLGSRGNTKATTKNYIGILQAAVKQIGKPVWQWRLSDIDAYLAYLANVKDNATSTQSVIITVLRSFQNWLLADVGLCNETEQEFGVRPAEYITEENSIAFKRKGKQRREPVIPLTKEEVARLIKEIDFRIKLAAAEGSKSLKTLQRNKAIIILILLTGLRIDEVASLTINSFMRDASYPNFGDWALIKIIGKGHKERTVRLYNPSIKPLMEWYIGDVRPKFMYSKTTDTKLLFYSERGGALPKVALRRELKEIALSAGISKRVTPHVLRHTFATEMLDILGAEGLQKQLGHTFLSTTLGTYCYQSPEETGQEVYLGVNKLTQQLNKLTKT